MSESELLEQLAERPFDRSLRLVFADWLVERGDPRGEVIALCARGPLSLTGRRRVLKITAEHGRRWLGALDAVVSANGAQFDGGFPVALELLEGVTPAALDACAEAPELATVHTIAFPLAHRAARAGRFLSTPRLRNLTCLRALSSVYAGVGKLSPAFHLGVLGLRSWSVFQGELDVLPAQSWVQSARRLDLETAELLTRDSVGEIIGSLAGSRGPLGDVEEVRLVTRHAVVEGAVEWLVRAAERRVAARFPRLSAWSTVYRDVVFTAQGEPGGPLKELVVDLTGTEGTHALGGRVATAAATLVQLAPLAPETVSVELTNGARLKAKEKYSLRSAARRLRTARQVTIDGDSVP